MNNSFAPFKVCRILLDMRLARWLMILLGALSPVMSASSAQTQARLVLAVDAAPPGETVMAGVHLHMNKGWHTYWRHPGDAGDATKIQWELPQGIAAGPIFWPVPGKDNFADLITYSYHDDVVLLVPLTLGKAMAEGPVQLKAKLSWLECEKEGLCVIGGQEVNATLTIAKASKPSANAKLIEQWKSKLPRDGSFLQATAKWDGEVKDDARAVIIEWSSTNTWTNPDFFSYASAEYEVSGNTEILSAQGKIRLRKTVKKLEGNWPAFLPGLLVNKNTAYEVQIPIAAAKAAPLNAAGLLGMLAFAFLGGLILNFMPCVLPVIALKVFGFVNQSKEHPKRVRALGVVYALGVLASFLVLAAMAIAVQQAGGLATWGMALQNQIVRVLLTIVMTLVALNLFGLFEVTLGGGMMSVAGDAASREGYSGAFFNGILATILATPCTAPFLTGALAFGFTQPPIVTALAFLAAGMGLAFPYVLLSWRPQLLKVLPKPGAWMEKFKIAMGFPMLATAVWLFWITAGSFGDSGVLWFGLFLVVLAAAAWTFGAFYQRSLKRRGLALAVVLVLLGAGYFGILQGQLFNKGDGIDWQRWSPEAVAEARAAGHPVLVDFTAKTCLNCIANKRTSLEIPSTRAKLKEINAVSFLGDFTDSDPRIAAELRKYARAGVPLVLVYPKDPAAPPLVLPPILTPGIVHDALDKAAKSDLNLSAR